MKLNIIFILLISIIFISCSSKNQYISKPINPSTLHTSRTYNNVNISSVLLAYHKEYKGVRYKWGGIDKNGLDCSAYVQNAFKSTLNINLPRTTLYQSRKGKIINKKDLQTGDLVFFRPSSKYRHVGIYLKNGAFMHVSTSKGVIISKLNNVYWSKYYWKSIRVIN